MPKVARAGKFRKAAKAQSSLLQALLPSAESTNTDPVDKSITKNVNGGEREKQAPVVKSDADAAAKNNSKKKKGVSEGKKDGSGKEQLSRGQRKRLAKREQYLRKERMVMSSLQLKKEEEQKNRIDGLDAIKEALLATISGDEKKKIEEKIVVEKPNLLKTNKGRQKLVEKEVTQMNLVLQHPSFKADPFATIREHLKNTLSKDSAIQRQDEKKHVKDMKEKEENKRVVKKENGAKRKRKKRFKATRSKSR